MECTSCKQQYVGKAETPFNIRLNNHRNDVKNPQKTLINMQVSILGKGILIFCCTGPTDPNLWQGTIHL